MNKPSKEAKLALALALRNRARWVQIYLIEYAEVIRCHTVGTAANEDNAFWVAKPWLVRSTTASHAGVSFAYNDGATWYSRVATIGSDSVTQIVVPAYGVGDRIVILPHSEDLAEASGTVHWIDANADSRFWANVL